MLGEISSSDCADPHNYKMGNGILIVEMVMIMCKNSWMGYSIVDLGRSIEKILQPVYDQM